MDNSKVRGVDAASEIITMIFLNTEGFHSGSEVGKRILSNPNLSNQWKESVLNFALGLASEMVNAGAQSGLVVPNLPDLLEQLKKVGRV